MLRKNFNAGDAGQVFGLVVISAVALSFVVAAAFWDLNDTSAWFWVVQGTYSLLLGLVAFLFSKTLQVDFVVAVKIDKKPKALDIVFLVVALFFLINAMSPINGWFCDLIEFFGLPRPSVSLTDEGITKNLVLAIFAICIVAPIAEELIFRGVIGNGLLQEKSTPAAIFFGGFLFAIFHMNPAQTLHQFLVGCLLMLFLHCGKSLWTVAIGHIANNVFAVVLNFTVEKTGFYTRFAVLCAVLGLLLFFAVVAVFVFLNRQSFQNTKQQKVKKASVGRMLLATGMAISLAFWAINLVQM